MLPMAARESRGVMEGAQHLVIIKQSRFGFWSACRTHMRTHIVRTCAFTTHIHAHPLKQNFGVRTPLMTRTTWTVEKQGQPHQSWIHHCPSFFLLHCHTLVNIQQQQQHVYYYES
jgi:hypothetical protein